MNPAQWNSAATAISQKGAPNGQEDKPPRRLLPSQGKFGARH